MYGVSQLNSGMEPISCSLALALDSGVEPISSSLASQPTHYFFFLLGSGQTRMVESPDFFWTGRM